MDKCREAFERNLSQKLRMPYEEVKARMDEYENITGYCYGKNGQNDKDWAIWCEAWQSRQAEVDQLKEAIERQGKLAIQAMNEAHKGSRLELSIAQNIQASLKPELIESERQMNAQLTDENMKLEARIDVACKSINSFFDNQVSTPTPREYANFIAEILEVLRGEHE